LPDQQPPHAAAERAVHLEGYENEGRLFKNVAFPIFEKRSSTGRRKKGNGGLKVVRFDEKYSKNTFICGELEEQPTDRDLRAPEAGFLLACEERRTKPRTFMKMGHHTTARERMLLCGDSEVRCIFARRWSAAISNKTQEGTNR
jgi:hypothetical protein